LEVLGQLAGSGQRFAVLGDMLELGPYAPEEHRLVGEAAARHVDRLILVGALARHIAEGAQQAGMPAKRITLLAADLAQSASLEAALTEAECLLRQEMHPHDIVLIKGSHGVGLYKLAERWVDTMVDS
jgi:UDP-N-acetylmuramoyl-tripeptide--D-alanyl-D-alanine ligase